MATFEELDNDAKAFDEQETSLSLSSAIKKNPEQSAKVYSLSKEKGLPFDYVDRNYDKVAAPNISDAGPNVAQLLRDREKASVVHDDVDNLKWWETAAQEAGNLGKAVYSGANTTSSAAYGILGNAYNALSAVTTAPFRQFASDEEINKYDLFGESGKYITGLAQQQNAYADQLFPTKSVINSSVLGGIKSAIMNVPALALGVATDNPVAALNSMIAMTYGNSYITAKDAGLSEGNAILYAGNQALAERVTEGIPVGRLFKDLQQNSGFLKTMGMQMATEVPTEELATLWQDAIDWAALHPDKTLADFKEERSGAFVDTLIATVVATGLQTGAIHTVDKLTRSREDAQIQTIADKANESKVNARSPEIFAQHVQDVAESYGAPDNVYLDAKEAKPLLQTMVKDSAYDLISAQIDQAEAVGGDVVIPMGEFASKVASSQNFNLLKNSIRLAPDSPTNSDITNKSDHIASLLDEANKNVELKTRADQIYQEVSKQLINSGRMNADTAKVNATLIPAYVTTKAARSGMSVDDIYGMMGLKIEGPNASGKKQDQSALLKGGGNAIENRLREKINNNFEGAVEEYNQRPDAMGGKVLNTDIARELSPDYLKNRTLSADVHEPASQFVKDLYVKKLAEKPTGKEEAAVLFTAGGTGSGKTTAVAKYLNADSYQIIYDTNMNSFDGAKQKIEQALAANKAVDIAMVYRDPVEALVNGALPRAMRQEKEFGTGRTVPISEHFKTHQGASETIIKLAEEYKDDPRVNLHIIDNSKGAGNASVSDVDLLRSTDYTKTKEDLIGALDEEFRKGKISKSVYEGFKSPSQRGGGVSEVSEQSNQREESLALNQIDRGSFDPKTNIIKLGEASNLSTFVHELGHSFLEMEGRLFSHPNATPDMKADGQVILDWLGLDSFEQLKDFETNDVSREAHEKFARGFEKYLGEGKAPSIELKAVFRRFAAWMKQVYRDLRNLNVELNDDIRAVMDRMLATDEQINRAKNVFDPLFKDAKDAGMTEPEFKAYTMESSPDSAKEVLLAKMIKQLKREYTKWWKDESIIVADQVRKEIAKQPLYSALGSIGSDETKIRSTDLEAHFSGKIPKKFNSLMSENGLPADDMAAIHGLASGSDLIDQITTEPSLSQKVKEQTHIEMVKRHGDILTDGTIEEEAAQAIRNPEHAKKLMAELSALSRKTKTPAIDREAIKAYAKETIGKMAYSKIRPAQYRSAEVRAAREAAIAKNKGDFEGAQKAKQQEIINFYLSREATAQKEKAEANRKYLQAIQVIKFNPKDVNADYITQMQAIANLYDFRVSSSDNQDRVRSRLQAISAWIDAQTEKEESGFYPVIIDSILNDINTASKNGLLEAINIPSYKEMTAEAIQGIADQVRNLRYVGGQLSENSKELLKQESKRVGDSIRANSKGVVDIPEEISKRDRRMSGLREFGQDHIRLANQIEELDGYKEFGPLFEAFYQDIIDSSNKELKLKRSTFEDIKVALAGLKSSEMAEGKDEKTFTYMQAGAAVPIKKTLTLSRRARIVFGLYWGSPEGREAIRQGHGMTDADAQQVLNSLEEKDLNAIEGIWKANEAHWPEVSRINQKLKGVTLPKVGHVPYVVNGRTLHGGYLRLYYQYDQKDSIREIKAEDLLMTRTGNRLAKQTKNGSRNERVGSGGRKVSWEFNNVFVALDETIHDIAFAETASKASRFIRSPAVSSAIIDGYGKEKYDSMVGALSGVISGNTAVTHPISGFLQHFRVAQTYGMLGYSIRNFVQQPLAYANVFGKSATSFEGFGEAKVLSEAIKFAMSPKETMKFVDSLSEFMINRTAIINRDTSEIKQRLSHGSMAGSAWDTFKDHAFDIQTVGDSLVAYPSWMAAYNEGLRKFANQKKAVTFADEFISATVGSGMVKDMSPMLQGGGRVGQAIGAEQLKSITFMGSFFNVNMNLMRDSFKKSNYLEVGGVKTIPTSPEFYRQMAWYLVIPALLGAWMTGGEPKDDETFMVWAAKEVGAYGLSAVFFVRDLVSLARGFGPSSSYTRALDSTAKLAKEAAKIYNGDKDVDEKTAAIIMRSAGMIFPIPGSGQAARTLEYLGSDDEFNPYKALVTGVDR